MELKCDKLPDVGISRITGLLEVVHDNKDAIETARVAMDLDLEFDELLPVIEAAELLGFVELKSGRICLTRQGKELVAGGLAKRRALFKKQLLSVSFFKNVRGVLEKKKRVKKRALIKYCRQRLTKKEAEKTIERLIGWGRHAEAFGYDSEKEELYLL